MSYNYTVYNEKHAREAVKRFVRDLHFTTIHPPHSSYYIILDLPLGESVVDFINRDPTAYTLSGDRGYTTFLCMQISNNRIVVWSEWQSENMSLEIENDND